MDLRQVFDDLVRFETDLWNEIDARLRRAADVPLGSLNVMLVIARTQACRVNDIATALSITIGGASQAVDRLEKRGLCTRERNPNDRRSSIVRLTAAGQALADRAGQIFDRELAARLAGPLSGSELGHLGAALAALRAATPHHEEPEETP
ncbi:MarR family winged helix-turn-helix transcriptional regulator [Saccharothrix sp. ST-888]|uniref:MarR family winged helix-turn-helix transcriptional regulator n=1 Tax=Saccharothrix sp. ST-888 TaxID=1427391 RepID=UPI0005EC844B|nr:MarR family transcriptional regulator [Saccharothrix sp. ST-888]KJK55381.1 MarR family transcriptional regulator [Saccharothrix sp. ST-888]